jgi:hypothetical protein
VDNLFNIINWDNVAYRLDNALKLTKWQNGKQKAEPLTSYWQ